MTDAARVMCARCDTHIQHKHGNLCPSCIADDMDYDDDDDSDPEGPAYECHGFYDTLGEFYCPMWGTEECDWECPYT